MTFIGAFYELKCFWPDPFTYVINCGIKIDIFGNLERIQPTMKADTLTYWMATFIAHDIAWERDAFLLSMEIWNSPFVLRIK